MGQEVPHLVCRGGGGGGVDVHPAGRGDTPTDVVVQGPECIGRGTGRAADDHITEVIL